MIIYLNPACAGPPENRDRRSSTAATVIVMRRYPRIVADRLSSLCFVLHRMGFFVPRELLRER
jgi:hypothetical protein